MMDAAEIAALERSWEGRVQVSEPARYYGWVPSRATLFQGLLGLCVPHAPSRTFLDAGCGIGTKCLLAQQMGLAAHGIDRVLEYVEEAQRLGVGAEVCHIENYTGYASFGIVYFYQPAPDDYEPVLEKVIHERMAPGAVLMSAAYVRDPGWPEIARLGERIAAWVKPLGA